MSGYQTYLRLQRIEEQAQLLGFRLGNPKHGNWGGSSDSDSVSLYPAEETLPVYSRDAEIFTGTFRDLEIFMAGWAKSQSYDMMLRMTDDKKRKRYEDKERERQRFMKEKLEKQKVFAILANKKVPDDNLVPKTT